jgi:hypothetical protein
MNPPVKTLSVISPWCIRYLKTLPRDKEPNSDSAVCSVVAPILQVNYHTYKMVRSSNPSGPMGGYTRLLHCGRPDDIHHLVPTLLVAPLPPGLDRGYGPMHRPWAFSQWLSRAHIPEEFIFMAEPDHVFLAQPPLVATAESPAAYPFWYVDCRQPQYKKHCITFLKQGVSVDHVPTVRCICILNMCQIKKGHWNA